MKNSNTLLNFYNYDRNNPRKIINKYLPWALTKGIYFNRREINLLVNGIETLIRDEKKKAHKKGYLMAKRRFDVRL